MKNWIKRNGLGLALSMAVAVTAYTLGKWFPVVGGAVFGITLGILLASTFGLPAAAQPGLKFTGKTVLQWGVVLLGFELSAARVLQVGRQSFLVIVLTLSVAFFTAYLGGKLLKVPAPLAALIGIGTAICGGSAIAAASSALDSDERDVSYSISTIFLFNIVAVFLFPALGHWLRMSDAGFGLWAGTAINDTSSVVAAGYAFSNAAGAFATVVKLTRSLMIVPVTLALAWYTGRARRGEGSAFSLAAVFPWFILGFLAAAALNSAGWLPAALTAGLAAAGKFLIVLALSAIGLNTRLQGLAKAGPSALLLGGLVWLSVMSSSLAVQLLSQAW